MARLSFRCGDDLVALVDVARGFEPRESWLRRAVERALSGEVQTVDVRSGLKAQASDEGSAPAEQLEQPPRGRVSPSAPKSPVGTPAPVSNLSVFAKRDVVPIPKRGS